VFETLQGKEFLEGSTSAALLAGNKLYPAMNNHKNTGKERGKARGETR